MSLRWGADDDTLSRGMDPGGKDIAAGGAGTTRADLDEWQRSKRRAATARSRSAKGASLQQQKLFKSQLAAQSAGQLVQAGLMGAQAGTAGARHASVKGAQAGTGARQAKVAGKIQQEGLYQDPMGGAPTGKMARLQARSGRLSARQTKLGAQRLAMEEANPYLTTKYDWGG